MNNKILVTVLAIFCNILWGSAFPFVKMGYEQFAITTQTSHKIVFAGIRFCIAGLILLVVYCIGKPSCFCSETKRRSFRLPIIKKDNLVNVCAAALVQTTIEYIFFYIGLSNTAASNGSIINSCSVFWGVILAHFLYKNDRLTWNKAVGCVVGFLGVLLVTLGEGQLHFVWNGEGFIVMASLAFAVGSMISKEACRKDDSVVVTGYNLLLGGAVLLVVGIGLGGELPQITASGIGILCYLSILSALAFSIWTWLLKSNPVGSISFYNFVIPIAGTILSAVFLKEDILRWNYAGALVLVTIGIFFIQRVNGQKQHHIPN